MGGRGVVPHRWGMKLTNDERQALAYIAALLLLSAAVRAAALPEPMAVPAETLDMDAHIEATERAVEEAARRERPLGRGERLDPNTAPVEELDRLPGVGPALAERIVEARAVGPFRSAAELGRVPGVGPRTAERLAPFLALPAEGGPARAGAGGPSAGAVIDLNRADAAALQSLPGVGPVLAERIVAYRDSAGPFLAVDSLRAVKGIGAATLDRIRGRLRVR